MSNYHVKTVSRDGRNATVVFHIPVPVENNSAGVALRTAVSEYVKPQNFDGTFGVFNSSLQNIDAAELTQIRNGELIEREETVAFLSADTLIQKQTKIDNRFTALTTSLIDELREVLRFWGKNRNV